MATEQLGFCVGREIAAADLSSSQYLFVKFTATGVALAGDGEHADGILQNNPLAGEVAEVCVEGISKLKVGAALAKGATVASSAAGKGVAPTTGESIIGKLLEASAADNNIVSCFIKYAGVSA